MIYLEIVPKELTNLLSTSHWINENKPSICGINIPDILRVPNRSYDTAIYLTKHNIKALPHIRMIDFSETELINLAHRLFNNNVTQLLLITGDPPLDLTKTIHNHQITTIIRLIKSELPDLTIYAALDPYRQNLKKEIDYAFSKIESGATGLFTQPIFDIHLAHVLLNQPFKCELFIGTSPVTDKKSYQYWCNRNNVFFPKSFELTMDHNVSIARSIIQVSKSFNQNNYLMPIKTDTIEYLKRVFHEPI